MPGLDGKGDKSEKLCKLSQVILVGRYDLFRMEND